MRPRVALATLAVVAAAALCVRLGFWQLARYRYKQGLEAARKRALAAAPLTWDGSSIDLDRLRERRVVLSGRYDSTEHVLLAYRERSEVPGVEVLTPLVTQAGHRVLVNRGWLEAQDGVHARPQDFPERGTVQVEGVAETLAHGRFGTIALEQDSVRVFSTRVLVYDSLGARLSGPLAPLVVRQLPGEGVPSSPRRLSPPPFETGMHLGYAIQWFLIAGGLLAGGFVLVQRGSRRR
jgi:surfeit locus 1 family protein